VLSLGCRWAVAVLSLCCRCAVAVLSLCCRWAVAVLSLCCRCAVAVPSLCRRCAAFCHCALAALEFTLAAFAAFTGGHRDHGGKADSESGGHKGALTTVTFADGHTEQPRISYWHPRVGYWYRPRRPGLVPPYLPSAPAGTGHLLVPLPTRRGLRGGPLHGALHPFLACNGLSWSERDLPVKFLASVIMWRDTWW
jgi:prepilin-type processing-associated H-X9-DG protein